MLMGKYRPSNLCRTERDIQKRPTSQPIIFEIVHSHEDVSAPNWNQGAEDNEDGSIDIGADIDTQEWERFQEKLRKQREETEVKSGRGPDLQPRQHQPLIMDSAAGESVKDWTKSDISLSLRILKGGTIEQIDRDLTKLDLRLWDATRK